MCTADAAKAHAVHTSVHTSDRVATDSRLRALRRSATTSCPLSLRACREPSLYRLFVLVSRGLLSSDSRPRKTDSPRGCEHGFRHPATQCCDILVERCAFLRFERVLPVGLTGLGE